MDAGLLCNRDLVRGRWQGGGLALGESPRGGQRSGKEGGGGFGDFSFEGAGSAATTAPPGGASSEQEEWGEETWSVDGEASPSLDGKGGDTRSHPKAT